MTKIKPGDAVRTPHGLGEVVQVGQGSFGPDYADVLLVGDDVPCKIHMSYMTRLVPDTGLEERVRADDGGAGMTKIKPGDAVMTPDGHPGTVDRIGRSLLGGEEGAVVTHAECPDGERFWLHRLTRLVPDTGLEERVRALADEWLHTSTDAASCDPGAGTREEVAMCYDDQLRMCGADLLALLDTPEAEPGIWECGACEYRNPADAAECEHCGLALAMLAARLRREE